MSEGTTKREADPGVLSPQWEAELRRGLEADGGQGSVEPELAIVHLLRHAAKPESLPAAGLDEVWREIEGAIEPTPWWKATWVRFTVPALATSFAAVAVLVMVRTTSAPAIDESVATRSELGATLEAQFEMLAPEAREQIEREVDESRSQVRAGLLRVGVESR